MADNVLTVVLQVKDEMSSAFKHVQKEIDGLSKQFKSLSESGASVTKSITSGGGSGGLIGTLGSLGSAVTGIGVAFMGVKSVIGTFTNALGEAFSVLRQELMQAAAFADQMDRLSKVMGVNVESLQKYIFVADIAGVKIGELQAAFRFLQLKAQAAADGPKQAAAAFEKLGINLKNNRALVNDMDKLFLLIADRLTNVTDRGEKMRIGNELMGRTFARLSPILEGGSAQIKALSDVMDAFGGVVTEKNVKSLDTFGDTLSGLEKIWNGMKANFMASVAESGVLENLAVAFAKLVPLATGLAFAVGALANAFSRAIDPIREFIGLIASLGELGAASVWDFFTPGVQGKAEIAAAFRKVGQAAVNVAATTKSSADSFINDMTRMGAAFTKAFAFDPDKAEQELRKWFAALRAGGEGKESGEVEGAIARMMNAFAKASASGGPIDSLVLKLKAIRTAQDELVKKQEEMADKEMPSFWEEIWGGNEEIDTSQLEALSALQLEYEADLQKVIFANNELHSSLLNASNAYALSGDKQALLSAETSIYKQKLDQVIATLATFNGEITPETVKRLQELQNSYQKSKDRLEEFNKEQARAKQLAEKMGEMSVYGGLSKALDDFSGRFLTFKDLFLNAFETIQHGMSSMFMNLFEGGKDFSANMKKTFESMKKSFLKTISDMLAQQIFRKFLAMLGLGQPGGAGPFNMMAGTSAQSAQMMAQQAANQAHGLPAGFGMQMGGGGGGGFGALMGGIGPLLGIGLGLGANQIGGSLASKTSSPFLKGLLPNIGFGGLSGPGLLAGLFKEAKAGEMPPILGALAGGGFFGPLGAVAGYFFSSKGKKDAEKQKEEQEAEMEQAQAELDAKYREAASVLKESTRLQMGGGLATTEGADEIASLFSGDITKEEIDKMGAGAMEQLIAAKGGVEALKAAQISVNAPIALSIGSIASSYDVQLLGADLAYLLATGLDSAITG